MKALTFHSKSIWHCMICISLQLAIVGIGGITGPRTTGTGMRIGIMTMITAIVLQAFHGISLPKVSTIALIIIPVSTTGRAWCAPVGLALILWPNSIFTIFLLPTI